MEEKEGTRVSVYGASSAQIDEAYIAAAAQFGRLAAARGWTCIHGGGSTGIMGAVTTGALEVGGHVRGIIPKFMVDNGWHDDRLADLVITADMHQRKDLICESGDALVAMPGGVGTLEELAEVMTWRQLGLITKPIVILNTAGYYAPLLELFDKAIAQGFMRASHRALWTVCDTPEQAIDAIAGQLAAGPVKMESKL